MKRLLLPLLAALALPTSVNAESDWLIISNQNGMTKIQMKDTDQCYEQGKLWKMSPIYEKSEYGKSHKFACLKGK